MQSKAVQSHGWPTTLLIGLVRLYQGAISPWTGPLCRHQPTCSTYAVQALQKHGWRRGGRLIVGRLMRCHPWGTCGDDPVPD